MIYTTLIGILFSDLVISALAILVNDLVISDLRKRFTNITDYLKLKDINSERAVPSCFFNRVALLFL